MYIYVYIHNKHIMYVHMYVCVYIYICNSYSRKKHVIFLRQQLLLDCIAAFMAAMEEEGLERRAPSANVRDSV
jgi:hypothetical protein